MMLGLTLVLLGLVQFGHSAEAPANATEVCYDLLGCFQNTHPYTNAAGQLPDSPEHIDAKFYLFTRANAPGYDVLLYNDSNTLAKSSFDPAKETKFVVHGFTASITAAWLHEAKEALLAKGDYNVVLVGWGNGAKFPEYERAVANLRLVAAEEKVIIDMMVAKGLDLKNVHLTGHSLGAHLSGEVGKSLKGQVGRITGLDPAEPGFENLDEAVRLDPTDAVFVDIIHSDAMPYSPIIGGYGLMQPSGHVDIYVNGGKIQPGCKDAYTGIFDTILHPDPNATLGDGVSCSHERSHLLWVTTLRYDSQCPYKSYPCESYDEWEKGNCISCDNGCSAVGLSAIDLPGRGLQYINTLSHEPFCGKSYLMTTNPAQGTPDFSTSGTIFLAVVGEQGTSSFNRVTDLKASLKNSVPMYKVAVFEDVGTPVALKIKYQKSRVFLFGGAEQYTVGDFMLKDPVTGVTYSTSGGFHTLHDLVPLEVDLTADTDNIVG